MTEDATTSNVEEMSAPSVGVRVDRALEWLGERFNPILVKESRQALKSRQFVLSFGLLLIAAWGWSFIGLVIMEVGSGYGQAGFEMFMGYYCILAAALALFVPFGAFRSLASEQEDQTYELLSITGLSPRQIVSGKLGSAVIQILIYTSAIAPCLAFTYMLRGISMPTILFAVTYTVLGSLGLSIVGLLVGTLTKEKHWQVLLSVVLIVALLIVFSMAIGFTVEMADEGDYMFRDPEFWGATGAMLTAYVTYAALVFYAAVAQVTFVSDNRATKLRVIMLIQHGCLVAWFGWLFLTLERMEIPVLYVFVSLTAIHWAIMGSMMTGEWPELSMRVRRRLPQSFLGRAFLTWFNPGPGTGYMFACGGVLASSLTALALLFAGTLAGFGGRSTFGSPETLLSMCVLVPSYVIAYLGVGLLLVRFLRRFTEATLFVSMLMQILLISIGTAAPFVVESIVAPSGSGGYSLLQITNPFWTIVHMTERSSLPIEGPLVMGLVGFMALMIFTLNLPRILHEVRHVRVAKPTRVIEEDKEMAPEVTTPEPVPASPWDVE